MKQEPSKRGSRSGVTTESLQVQHVYNGDAYIELELEVKLFATRQDDASSVGRPSQTGCPI